MNEELSLAVEEFRLRLPGATWLMPVRLDAGDLPDWDLGAGRVLTDLNHVDLFGDAYAEESVSLTAAINRVMGSSPPTAATAQAAVAEAGTSERAVMLRRMAKEMVLDPTKAIQLDDLVSQEASRILAAMRDEGQFPVQGLGGTNRDHILTLAETANNYWTLAEPFCFSLQVGTRWADPTSIGPWASAMRGVVAEGSELRGAQHRTFGSQIPARTVLSLHSSLRRGGTGPLGQLQTAPGRLHRSRPPRTAAGATHRHHQPMESIREPGRGAERSRARSR